MAAGGVPGSRDGWQRSPRLRRCQGSPPSSAERPRGALLPPAPRCSRTCIGSSLLAVYAGEVSPTCTEISLLLVLLHLCDRNEASCAPALAAWGGSAAGQLARRWLHATSVGAERSEGAGAECWPAVAMRADAGVAAQVVCEACGIGGLEAGEKDECGDWHADQAQGANPTKVPAALRSYRLAFFRAFLLSCILASLHILSGFGARESARSCTSTLLRH